MTTGSTKRNWKSGGRKAALDAILGLDLRKRHLKGANFFQSVLLKIDFREARLEGADLEESNLDWADLTDADLSFANLRDTKNLDTTELGGADFAGADLTGTVLDINQPPPDVLPAP